MNNSNRKSYQLSHETRIALHKMLRTSASKLEVCRAFNISFRTYYHHRDVALGRRELKNGLMGWQQSNRLSQEQRLEAYNMRHVEGLPYLRIALHLKVSQAAVFRAIQKEALRRDKAKADIPITTLIPVEEIKQALPLAPKEFKYYHQSDFIKPVSRERLMAGR